MIKRQFQEEYTIVNIYVPNIEAKYIKQASLVEQMIKNLPAMQETRVQSLGQEDTLEKEMATLSSIGAWRIPWTEEPGRHSTLGRKELYTTKQLTHIKQILTDRKGESESSTIKVGNVNSSLTSMDRLLDRKLIRKYLP